MANGTHTLEVWGDLACFTRPEMKVERFSYPVITPSAARGIFDAIYWDGKREKAGIRPYFYWQVTRIEVLEMPRYIALRRNEVKGRVPGTSVINRWMRGDFESSKPVLKADGDDETTGRTQRQTMALKNVRYRLSARIVPKPGNDWGKLNACFQRRARAGKCFQQPYFGCREFPAFFEYIEEPDISPAATAPLDQHLGLMLYDVFDLRKELVRDNDEPFITLFDATVRNGVLEVPSFDSETVKKPREETKC
jgi:CRISPR-associated protein Cas5d